MIIVYTHDFVFKIGNDMTFSLMNFTFSQMTNRKICYFSEIINNTYTFFVIGGIVLFILIVHLHGIYKNKVSTIK